jgi:hypothetical protein
MAGPFPTKLGQGNREAVKLFAGDFFLRVGVVTETQSGRIGALSLRPKPPAVPRVSGGSYAFSGAKCASPSWLPFSGRLLRPTM